MDHGPYVVIEGADGTGKTHLAHRLESGWGFSYVHTGPPEWETLRFNLDQLRSVQGKAVMDRLSLGPYVYGTAFSGGTLLAEYEQWLLDCYLMSRGAVLVHCRVPEEQADANMAKNPDTSENARFEAPEKQRLVRLLYQAAVEVSPLVHMDYDYTTQSETIIPNIILELAKLRPPRFDAGMLGNSSASLVFVGDRPNLFNKAVARARKGGYDQARYLSMLAAQVDHGVIFDANSGRYLWEALRAAKMQPRDYCILNSLQWDGRTVTELVNTDPKWWLGKQVVAMGRLAEQQCQRAGLLVSRTVPHPQHFRRFHYRELDRYGEMLKGEESWEGCPKGATCRPS